MGSLYCFITFVNANRDNYTKNKIYIIYIHYRPTINLLTDYNYSPTR